MDTRAKGQSMKQKIKTMSLQQVKVFKEQISLSTAKREVKTELYQACEVREKELDLSNAIVVKSEVDA